MTAAVKTNEPCPVCGKPLPSGALAGMCPACLLDRGAETEEGPRGATARFQPPSLAELSRIFPQLEILGLLGAGGMGAVYKARQPSLDRFVALKILPAGNTKGANFTERFNREARALARLSHLNIVAVHEFGQTEALHFFIMEFVDGANLRQLELGARLSPREALQIIPQICDALQYAHDEGVVHRDIKPENVLLDRRGRVKIADFGLAKILGAAPESSRLTVEGQVMGTPHYMAPEQVEHPLTVDHRADIYALGVVFYEMLTGDLPLGKFSPPSRKVQVDVRLDDVVLRALENDPARRYQHASEVKQQVETITGSVPPSSAPTPSPLKEAPRRSLHWAGFPLVVDKAGTWVVNRKEALRAWAILFGLLTIAFAFVSAITGNSLLGSIGIIGWPSLVARAGLALLIVAWGLHQAMRRRNDETTPRAAHGTVVLDSGVPFWRRRRFVVGSLLLLAVTWTLFRELSLGTKLREWSMERAQPVAIVALPSASVTPSASAELWSPALAPGEKADPGRIRDEANEMMGRAEYEPALQRHLWVHNHALEAGPGQVGVRLSFYLSDWAELGRRYPKAKQAMLEVRDKKTRDFDEGRGSPELFGDVRSLNHYLGEEGKTVALFKTIAERDSALARGCIHWAKDSLVKEGEYEVCLKYLPPPQSYFEQSLVRGRETDLQRADRGTLYGNYFSRDSIDSRFIAAVSELLQMLRAVGRNEEAESIREQASALVDDPAFAPKDAPSVRADPTSLRELPPVVTSTYPVAGSPAVEAGVVELRVIFNKTMTDKSWSWSAAWENSMPEMLEQPRFETDQRSCVLKVRLEAGRTYGCWLNSEKFKNFKDSSGQPAVPYLLVFATK